MNRPPTGRADMEPLPSRDILARPVLSTLVWWLPQAAIAAALLAPIPARAAIWIAALVWTGAACLLNAKRCGRTHCRYTGPFYLGMVVPVMAAAWVSAPMTAWIALAVAILIGGKVIWWATERAWGKFGRVTN